MLQIRAVGKVAIPGHRGLVVAAANSAVDWLLQSECAKLVPCRLAAWGVEWSNDNLVKPDSRLAHAQGLPVDDGLDDTFERLSAEQLPQ